MALNRRTFLQLLSTGALAGLFPDSIGRALAIPARVRTGTIDDVEHVVVLMQENRSFDHYFGTLQGVRGFGDPRAVTLASGRSVFAQPNGAAYVLPFHPAAPNLGLTFLQDLPHDWASTQRMWNLGNYDQWVPNKSPVAMAHLVRSDIPYHYALADAFTICDAYHCSLLGPTEPNQFYMWTGWVGNDGSGGGPVVDNTDANYSWHTYPERLQAAGISWKIYQDIGEGLGAVQQVGASNDPYVGNYGDNVLLAFTQYQAAQPGSPLYEGAQTGTQVAVKGTLFDELKQDIAAGKLPQVSWVVAPEAYTEHPNWPANYGAWYVSQILDALTENPEVWAKTVFLVTYDENDGFFDHVPPPTVPVSRVQGLSTVNTTNEIYAGSGSGEYPSGPYGMGVRVPMLVISPWSKGGYVNSQVFDHTSILRFLEQRFGTSKAGLEETNITPWRRAVAGDLTTAFNFATPNDAMVPLPSTVAYQPPDNQRHPDYVPTPPAIQALPVQETGVRPARALPYVLEVQGAVNPTTGEFGLRFANSGSVAAVFQVRAGSSTAGSSGPWTYTVGAGEEVSDSLAFAGSYDLSVYGPNGFYRGFQGEVVEEFFGPRRRGESLLRVVTVPLETEVSYEPEQNGVTLKIQNMGTTMCPVSVQDGYTKKVVAESIRPGATLAMYFSLAQSFGWYDLMVESKLDASFQRHLAGHVETGRDSMTDPGIGASQGSPARPIAQRIF
jgi:phospholipase C